MPETIELRCTCTNKKGNHPLLGRASGDNFRLEVKCGNCKKVTIFQHPHPLSAHPEKNA